MREQPEKTDMKPARPKLSTEAYKGVRDFYPDDMAIQKHIFNIWRSTVERFGYEEYSASILEPADLYRTKTSDEIVNDQTYTFVDRGDREVTLRPEITPTVARMVAARKRELGFPLRWYSIPNLFRYEQPQRGRLREFWQLNVDIFGVESVSAEVEVIQIASSIMTAYGFKEADFEVRLNNRKIMNYILHDVFGLTPDAGKKMSKLIDKKEKLPKETFTELATAIFTENSIENKTQEFLTLLNSQNFEEFVRRLPQTQKEHVGIAEIKDVIARLSGLGINNIRFDQTLMRGFDYYTGIVFEVFDLNPANRRAVFGGGRYDDLLSIFGNGTDKVPAVGFGTGDVTTRDMLETYNLLPKVTTDVDLYIAPLEEKFVPYANRIADAIRAADPALSIAVDYTNKKIGDKIKTATKKNIPFVVIVGDDEEKTGEFKIKHLETGKEVVVNEKTIIAILNNHA